MASMSSIRACSPTSRRRSPASRGDASRVASSTAPNFWPSTSSPTVWASKAFRAIVALLLGEAFRASCSTRGPIGLAARAARSRLRNGSYFRNRDAKPRCHTQECCTGRADKYERMGLVPSHQRRASSPTRCSRATRRGSGSVSSWNCVAQSAGVILGRPEQGVDGSGPFRVDQGRGATQDLALDADQLGMGAVVLVAVVVEPVGQHQTRGIVIGLLLDAGEQAGALVGLTGRGRRGFLACHGLTSPLRNCPTVP